MYRVRSLRVIDGNEVLPDERERVDLMFNAHDPDYQMQMQLQMQSQGFVGTGAFGIIPGQTHGLQLPFSSMPAQYAQQTTYAAHDTSSSQNPAHRHPQENTHGHGALSHAAVGMGIGLGGSSGQHHALQQQLLQIRGALAQTGANTVAGTVGHGGSSNYPTYGSNLGNGVTASSSSSTSSHTATGGLSVGGVALGNSKNQPSKLGRGGQGRGGYL